MTTFPRMPMIVSWRTRAAYIVLNVDTKQPIELGDFVGGFTSIASQYDKFVARSLS